MLTLERCRRLLDGRENVSDSELEAIREGLYLFARAAVRTYREDTRKRAEADPACAVHPFRASVARVRQSEPVEIEERAAILEYDAGSDRGSAERRALEIWIERKE
jgi:hypothetical protein